MSRISKATFDHLMVKIEKREQKIEKAEKLTQFRAENTTCCMCGANTSKDYPIDTTYRIVRLDKEYLCRDCHSVVESHI